MDNYYSNNTQKLGDVLLTIAKKIGAEDSYYQSIIEEKWKEFVGEILAEQAKIKKFDKGNLIISVSSSTWRTELKLRKASLIKKINESLGMNLVNEIIFK
jgi:predicted nucleic acid-binding Zn ribbon protein